MPAAKAARPTQPASAGDMTDGQLADEHRGQSFAKRRAEDRLAAIEAELDRRNLAKATGAIGAVKKTNTGLGRVDLKRLRAERPDICEAFALPGTHSYWTARTLSASERNQ